MPKIDLTISITVIVAIAAIISPVITTLLNNHYQLKIKKMEMQQKQYEDTVLYRRQIIENYLQALSVVMQTCNRINQENYAKYYSVAYLYLPDAIQKEMSEINHLIYGIGTNCSLEQLDRLITDIDKELQKL
jgi:hypothetical protein